MIVGPEEGLFLEDRAVDYLRWPRPIIGLVLVLGIGYAVSKRACRAGTVDPAT
jgi:hypothetical protein